MLPGVVVAAQRKANVAHAARTPNLTPSHQSLVEVPLESPRIPGPGWPCVLVLFLMLVIVTVVGGILYFSLRSEFDDLKQQVKTLTPTSADVASKTTQRARGLSVQEQQDPASLLLPPVLRQPQVQDVDRFIQSKRQQKNESPASPTLATVAHLQSLVDFGWVIFDTPGDQLHMRLPASGPLDGLWREGLLDDNIQCEVDGDQTASLSDQIGVFFRTNDETGEDFAEIKVWDPVYFKRRCRLFWIQRKKTV